nr:immunoglobulin heavy chain junction region [Mus musculus]MBK4185434.1 immunoglobulin heavy chain junction region [Mus musculus]MBK4185435.1 immunoglobulin heavy chain junction region [Mus musculus]MBK4185436.1 immunoglobulin heavy chain junction region [Mus musculus]MBK4185437.1 immunoglobulin heavy chain junction region [Mus musculus]
CARDLGYYAMDYW